MTRRGTDHKSYITVYTSVYEEHQPLKRLQETRFNRNWIFFSICTGNWSRYARISRHDAPCSLSGVWEFGFPLDTVYEYVVPWSEFPIAPPFYPHSLPTGRAGWKRGS